MWWRWVGICGTNGMFGDETHAPLLDSVHGASAAQSVGKTTSTPFSVLREAAARASSKAKGGLERELAISQPSKTAHDAILDSESRWGPRDGVFGLYQMWVILTRAWWVDIGFEREDGWRSMVRDGRLWRPSRLETGPLVRLVN